MYFRKSLAAGMAGLLLLLVSCKKAEDRTCFKSWGDEAEMTVSLPEFDKLLLREQIEFILVQDSTDCLVIRGGKNMIKHIEWQINEEKVLEIKNTNRCNFLRNLNRRVKVEIHFTRLANMQFEGTEPLINRDTLNLDYFSMMIRDGAGSVRLNLNAIMIYADISHGWGDYTLAGKAEFARIAARSNGFCDVFDLAIKDSLEVYSETPGTIKVNAAGIPVRGKIRGSGDVWYRGFPSLVQVEETSTGLLVSKN